jgi:hypothetical protein
VAGTPALEACRGDLYFDAAPVGPVVVPVELLADGLDGGGDVVGYRHVDHERVVITRRAGHDRLGGERAHENRRDPDRDHYQQSDPDVALPAAPTDATAPCA